jgi:glycerol kinase
MQFQADVLGVDVVRPRVTETTALGAAYCAGLHVGYWKDATEVSKQWQEQHRFHALLDRTKRDELLKGWARAVERSRNWETPA